VLTAALFVAYLVWGGGTEIEELVRRVTGPRANGEGASEGSGAGAPAAPENGGETEEKKERYRVLVPIARLEDASKYVRLAELLAMGHDREPIVQVVTVTQIPDQTPHEVVAETASERGERLEGILAEANHPVEYTVESHTCRDVAFDILQTARNDGADLVLMGYPEENEEITEKVEFGAPCNVAFVSGFEGPEIGTVNVGAGGGPHHLAALPLVRSLGKRGAEVHVVSVSPEKGGSEEDAAETVSEMEGIEDIVVHNVEGETVAEGLVKKAAENGGVLVIGASRDRRFRRWVFGSTPDRVVELAREEGVPVLVYASSLDVPERIEDYLSPVYRYLRKLVGRTGATATPEKKPKETEPERP
jgi:APA family basic amino acid/polyamine antiporter